jgi:hypothetical protein
LPTPYRKIVAADDDGRFVIPDMAAQYRVWVRRAIEPAQIISPCNARLARHPPRRAQRQHDLSALRPSPSNRHHTPIGPISSSSAASCATRSAADHRTKDRAVRSRFKGVR